MLRTQARFPDVPAGKGHYESFYLKACHPSEPLGIWIRYTVHKHSRPGAAGVAVVHALRRQRRRPAGVEGDDRRTSPRPDDAYIRIARQHVRGRARRRAARSTDQLDASWELSFGSDEEPLFHLARDWMYRAPVPKTKLLTPYPDARFDGVVRAGEREVRLEGWRGMIGHNWGTPARRALDLAPRRRLRGGRGRLARRGDRQDQARAGDDAVDRERDALHRRRAPSARRAREGARRRG